MHLVGETQARPVKTPVRNQIKYQLKYESPSALFNKKFTTLTEEELMSGNRDKIGSSLSTLQKNIFKKNLEKLRDKDILKSLLLIKKEMDSSLEVKGMGNYLQRVSASHFHIILYTPTGIRLYHHQSSNSTLFCDATGTIVAAKDPIIPQKKIL